MVYRPDFYDVNIDNRIEWYPNGIFRYNISRMIGELERHEAGKEYLNLVIKASVSVQKAIAHNHRVNGLEPEPVALAGLSRSLITPAPVLLQDRDLDSRNIWNRIAICLNECRRVELYNSEGEWFTLFRLNGRLFCGEGKEHRPSIKCSAPWQITETMLEDLIPVFEDWQGDAVSEHERKDVRQNIRKADRHVGVIMTCIRIFSEY